MRNAKQGNDLNLAIRFGACKMRRLNQALQIVLTHHKSDRRPVNDLQRVVACVTALCLSILDAFLISGIFNRKFFEIQNTSLGKTFENNFN